MASGQVNRAEQAEHMAAPTNAAIREESPCQLGAVHTWPFCEVVASAINVGCVGNCGPELLDTSLTAFGPKAATLMR